MHVSYLINVFEDTNADGPHVVYVTDYLAPQLARSHRAPTGTGDDNQLSAIDILTRIGSHRVMSFLVPMSGIAGPAIHPLQMLASQGRTIFVQFFAKKNTLVKPNPQVTVALAGCYAKIHSIFPLEAGYEVNLNHVSNFWLKKVLLDENEIAERDKIIAALEVAQQNRRVLAGIELWMEELKKKSIVEARAAREEQTKWWLRPR